MDKIYEYLKGMTNFYLDKIVNERTGEIDNIYVNAYDKIYYSICGPHSGNDFTFLVRADSAATHDRWSNCMWEHNFEDEEQVVSFFRIGGLEAVATYVTDAFHTMRDTVEYMINEIERH